MKIYDACPLIDHGVLFSSSHTPKNAAIPLVGNTGVFEVDGLIISGGKVALDLLLDERRGPLEFGCTASYGVRMRKEQINILLYTLDL